MSRSIGNMMPMRAHREGGVKIALIGYGKMGQLVETLAIREGWEIGPRLDLHNNPNGAGITAEVMQGVDVGVDFSQPDAVQPNIEAAARVGLNLVVGTTGWYQARDAVEKMVREARIGLVYGSNFSVGMNLFFEIVAHAARVIGKAPQYDPYLAEEHHRAKKDAPSGTALSLRDLMQPYLGKRNPGVASTRAGHIPGNHVVGFDSEAEDRKSTR